MATFRINGPSHLLQTFRLAHAMAETEHTIQIPAEHQPRWEVLKQHFGTKYEVGNDAPLISVTVDHQTPSTGFNGTQKPLIFAASVADKCKALWHDRTQKFTFTGLVTPQREKRFLKWNQYVSPSQNGREWPLKAWDNKYFADMAKTEFTLCPSSDFVWTYRFYEAALCGSIPVVEQRTPAHAGYVTKLFDDEEFEWSEKDALHNYQLAVSQLVINPDDLSDMISDALGEPRVQRVAAKAEASKNSAASEAETVPVPVKKAAAKKPAAKKPAAKKRPGRPRKT